MNASKIKQTTWPNSPANPDKVILRWAEVAGAGIFAAAESTSKRLCADRRNQRPVSRAVLRLPSGCNQSLALFQFGTRPERLLHQRIQGSVGFNERQRHEVGVLRNQFNAGVEMQDLSEARGRHALPFERLSESELIALRLRLHTEFVAFERNAGTNRIMQLFLIVL